MPRMDSFVTPRPVPQFNVVNTFSTKKERPKRDSDSIRIRSGVRRALPPTPTPVISAYYSCPGPQKAHTISFKQNNTSSLSKTRTENNWSSPALGPPPASAINSPLYNQSREDTYFRQAFDVQANIGSGSFGDVFRVRCKEDGRMYAVKRSRVPFRGTTDRREKLEEVRKMESLPHHPNCVRFYRAWEERQYLYIQLELCATSLSQVAEQQHELPEVTIWDYMIDLLLAIQHLHDNDLIHLDVKPENILLSMDGVCKLGDFGLVVNLKENLMDAVEGDSKYLAPEVLSGRFSKKADIFSLGVTLLELACDLDLPANGQLWHELRCGTLPPEFTRQLSKELVEVLELMMNPDPSARPSAAQLLAHPYLKSRKRWRRLRLGWTTSRRSAVSALLGLILRIFQIFLLFLLPLRALARKWWSRPGRNGDGPSTPVVCRAPLAGHPSDGNLNGHDFSFSDDEVSDLSSAVISGNDSTLGRPLNDSSPLPSNNSMDHHHRNDEQPLVSSTPLVLRGGGVSMRASSASARRSSLRRSIFSNGKTVGDHLGGDLDCQSPSKPIPRKLNDYFDAIASDSD